MERTDKLKNQAKVIKEILKNPLQTQREIAKKTGMGLGTVNDKLNKLEQLGIKDDRILGVCEKDFEIVRLGQAIIEERLRDKNETDKMRTFEIAQTIEKSEKRYMLFKGNITDNKGGLNIINSEDKILLDGILKNNLNE